MHWSLGKLLVGSFLIMAALMATVGIFSVYSLRQVNSSTDVILHRTQPILIDMTLVEQATLFHSLKISQYTVTGNKIHLHRVDQLRRLAEARLADLQQHTEGTPDEALVQEIQEAYNTYRALSEDLLTFYEANPTDTLSIVGRQIRVDQLLENALLAKAETLYDRKQAEAQVLVQANQDLAQSHIQAVLLSNALLTFLALITGFVISRSINRSIYNLIATTRSVAAGDLAVRAPEGTYSETTELAQAFNRMTAQVQDFVTTLEQRVAERTANLHHTMQDLATARAAAEEANRMKSQFLANMSHELRTPLNAIINFTKFLSRERYGVLTERQTELQKRVLFNAEHLLGIINDILDLAKIESGRMELIHEEIDLSAILQGVMATAVGLTKDKGLSLALDCPEQMPPIRVDKTRIRQVLLNLLSNAAKFTETGGITIRAARSEGNMICIAVTDTGIGISPEDQTLVFEEFRQVQGELTRQYEGTGLGLPISKRLVEMHGGQMWLESTPGKGSTFYFTLPILTVPTNPEYDSSTQATNNTYQTKPLVIVVDDDKASQEIFKHCLEEAGCQVHEVLDSREALPTIRHLQPQLVILDVLMPHLDGWEVLSLIKGTPETATIPILISSIVDQQRLGLSLGAADYLVKPIHEEDLIERVTRLLRPPGRILVIDDDPDARQIIRMTLSNQQYQVIEAATGAEGLAAARKETPDVVVLDLMMPEMDGFTVLEHLRAEPAFATLPVIIMTAKDLDLAERQWLCERSVVCFQKSSFAMDAFAAQIAPFMRQSRGGKHESL